jgi:sec-independent protein translocase protein TatA
MATGAQRGVRTSMSSPLLMPRHSRVVSCRGLFGLGLPELAVIAGVTALIFGPSKLPELGKGLGKTVKSFQTAAKEFETELKAAASEDDGEKKPDGKEKEASKQ